MRLAVRTPDGIRFKEGPFYFAEPGSAIERGFLDRLTLIDADRPYPQLFDALGITRLSSGTTVNETLLSVRSAIPAVALKQEIIEELSPYLLALVLVRADRPGHVDLAARRLRERLDVLALPTVRVALTLAADPTVSAEVQFPHVYLQRRLVQQRGVVEEARYSLYVATLPSSSVAQVDGDALGDALAPVFLEGAGADFAGNLARVVTRYQQTDGDRSTMERFLLEHLGISHAAQHEARAILAGEEGSVSVALPIPPATLLVRSRLGDEDEPQDLRDVLTDRKQEIEQQAEAFLAGLTSGEHDGAPGSGAEGKPKAGRSTTTIAPHITPEQERRGRRGEEEILRRLQLPGGWERFLFLEDHRDPPRGYDFLCSMGRQRVKLEVKTSMPDGQIVVTPDELREAAGNRNNYYLVCVLDDGGPPASWGTTIIRDPLDALLREGRLSMKADLYIDARSFLSAVKVLYRTRLLGQS